MEVKSNYAVVEAAVVKTALTAQISPVWLLLQIASLRNDIDMLSDTIGADKRFPLGDLKKLTEPGDGNKDASDTEVGDENQNDSDDDDEEGDEDDDLSDDDSDDEDDSEDDSDAIGDGASDDNSDDDDNDEEDDDDEESDDDDEDDEEEDQAQPPFKKKKHCETVRAEIGKL
ncbi:phosphopantothenoylcysteine decarboxylase subunit VHS3-like isoform X2 [Cornus florida]|uniref:phosphopantothenoylcysteine decarboxylase subunit VHS3-like isoform X2 n=1 Tax=Cornus florida TaxID=4283 RepID=UPI00289BDE46|nr:phosphopantothenoylcysteine decarboxylase subunit VHS3-like isoform X2 [Cornus florida]XP_059643266.1 phosphopantothenoylcysteine decarboxylase subunit VHS3-like isoform X2 [Cornus florida]